MSSATQQSTNSVQFQYLAFVVPHFSVENVDAEDRLRRRNLPHHLARMQRNFDSVAQRRAFRLQSHASRMLISWPNSARNLEISALAIVHNA